MKLRKTLALIIAVFAFSTTAFAEETYTMKLATISPEDTTWVDYAYKVRKEVAEKSNGRLKIIWYTGGVMGDEVDMVKKVRMGQLQGGVFTLVGLGKMVPATTVFELPMFFKSAKEVDYVFAKTKSMFERMFEEKHYVLAGFAEIGFARIFSNKPFDSVDDGSDIKMWTFLGDQIPYKALNAIGIGNVTPLAFAEVLPSLQTGLINAFYATSYAAIAMQWASKVKYVTDWAFAYTPGGIVVDQKFFRNELPKDLQDIFLAAWEKVLPELAVQIRSDEKKSIEALIASGVCVVKGSDSFIVDLTKRSEKLYQEFAGKIYPQSLLVGLLKHRNQFRASQH